MNGNTKCVYTAPIKDVKRFSFKLPAKITQSNWMQQWFQSVGGSHSVEVEGAAADVATTGGRGAAAAPAAAGGGGGGAEASSSDINKMKLKELKEELKTRGLAVSGNKSELVGRLEAAMIVDEPEPDGGGGGADAAAVGVKRGIDEIAGVNAIPDRKKKLKAKDDSDSGPSGGAVQAAPKREKPMAGSQILEVHVAYKQHGNYDSATVATDNGGTEVYNVSSQAILHLLIGFLHIL